MKRFKFQFSLRMLFLTTFAVVFSLVFAGEYQIVEHGRIWWKPLFPQILNCSQLTVGFGHLSWCKYTEQQDVPLWVKPEYGPELKYP